MPNIINKIKRKFTEMLLSHWYPNVTVLGLRSRSITRGNKIQNLTDIFVNITSVIIWFITKPVLKFLSIITEIFFFTQKNSSLSNTFFYTKKKSSPTIIAIGNLIVGGAGKTPSTICLIKQLKTMGITSAVISRGYKGEIDKKNKKSQFVELISPSYAYEKFGDEPCLVAETGVPVCVGNRADSLQKINSEFPKIDLILLDDGLQQKKIRAHKKILVVDSRLAGNESLLPYGPLREKLPLVYKIDALILNLISDELDKNTVFEKFKLDKKTPTGHLRTASITWKNTNNKEIKTQAFRRELHQNYKKTKIKPLAVAGIAVPSRFFKILEKLKIDFEPLWLPNHDSNFAQNLSEQIYISERIVLMTEKDGVRIIYSGDKQMKKYNQLWILKLNLSLESNFINNIRDWI
tara:strand:- start:212 stop:1429 length:1218 start_codon:yes stop_codon:yes gene_type:complete